MSGQEPKFSVSKERDRGALATVRVATGLRKFEIKLSNSLVNNALVVNSRVHTDTAMRTQRTRNTTGGCCYLLLSKYR